MSVFKLLAAVLLTGGVDPATCRLSDGSAASHLPTLTQVVADGSPATSPSLVLRAVRSSQDSCAPHISAIDDEYLYLDDGSVLKEDESTGVFRNLGKGSRPGYIAKAPPGSFGGLPLKSAVYVLGVDRYLGLWSDGTRSVVGTFVDGKPATAKRLGNLDAPARSITFAGFADAPVGMIYVVTGASTPAVLLSHRWDYRTWRW